MRAFQKIIAMTGVVVGVLLGLSGVATASPTHVDALYGTSTVHRTICVGTMGWGC